MKWRLPRPARTGAAVRPARSGESRFHSTLLAPGTTARLSGSPVRWALAGAALGLVAGAVVFAPARWLAEAITQQTGGRLTLAEPQGSLWTGSAITVLTGGNGSREASAPTGRLHWRLRPAGLALRVELQHDCCLAAPVALVWRPGLAQHSLQVQPAAAAMTTPSADGRAPGGPGGPVDLGRWPTAWLVGLGTPWNSLQPGGSLQISATGLGWRVAEGRVRQTGSLTLTLDDLSSRLSTLPALGSYRLTLSAPPGEATGSQIGLNTLTGPLRLSGTGTWQGASLRFRGEAQADPGSEAALANLLNIIGRRQGQRSILSIG